MGGLHKLVLSVLVAVSTLLALPVSAFAFSDDFEDGNTEGWLQTIVAGGVGSCGVESHNGSQMGFCKQIGSGQQALSIDFTYSPAEILSFDMHAQSIPECSTGLCAHARSGIAVSFLTGLNIPLGTVGLYHVTDLSWLPANSYAIDDVQHNYNGTFASFASLAGLDPANSAIAKLSIRFQATASTSFFGSQSLANVWFDNVNVPEPDTSALVLAGLAVIAVAARRPRSVS